MLSDHISVMLLYFLLVTNRGQLFRVIAHLILKTLHFLQTILLCIQYVSMYCKKSVNTLNTAQLKEKTFSRISLISRCDTQTTLKTSSRECMSAKNDERQEMIKQHPAALKSQRSCMI